MSILNTRIDRKPGVVIQSGVVGAIGNRARASLRALPGLLLALILLSFATERPAAAYTDPGSGALIWQMLVAGFVGAMFYFRKFTSWFRARKKDPAKD